MNKIICPSCMKEVNKTSFCELCHEGLLLNNKYYLLKILGKNIGTTYLAEDIYAKQVIIKELSLSSIEKWNAEEDFKKEGEILSQLNHPLIPNFIEEFQLGVGKNENYYIIMEFIKGITLREEFTQKRYREDEVIDILIGVAGIMQYLHTLRPSVVHRDIKLSNIIRREDKKISLIDFGSVKDIVENSTLSGTFGFMAPEQFKGESRIENDFYSLGVVAVVLLTRKEPEELMDDGITLNWKENLFISNNFKKLLGKLLEVKPDNRLNDVTSLIKELNLIKKWDNEAIPVKSTLAEVIKDIIPNKTDVPNIIQDKNRKQVEKKKSSWELTLVIIVAILGVAIIFVSKKYKANNHSTMAQARRAKRSISHITKERFNKGCNNGSGYSCDKLGDIYNKGNLKDKHKASVYYKKACDLNFKVSCAKFKSIK